MHYGPNYWNVSWTSDPYTHALPRWKPLKSGALLVCGLPIPPIDIDEDGIPEAEPGPPAKPYCKECRKFVGRAHGALYRDGRAGFLLWQGEESDQD